MSKPFINAKVIVRSWVVSWVLYFVLSTLGFLLNISFIANASSLLFLAGLLLTLPAFILLYRGKGKVAGFNPSWIIYACLAAWASYLLLIGSVNIIAFNSSVSSLIMSAFGAALLLTPPAIVVAILGLSNKQHTPQWVTNGQTMRIVAALIVTALATGTYCAIHALWLTPEAGKFIYTNIANGCGFGTLVLIVFLSYAQKNVYWISRQRSAKLDEREVKERQQVFETSYKIGTLLVAAGAYFLYSNKHNLPYLINDFTNFNVSPGNMYWPIFNLTLLLFALPLIIAAYRTKMSKND